MNEQRLSGLIKNWDFQPGLQEGTLLTGGVLGRLPEFNFPNFQKATSAGSSAGPGSRSGRAARYAECCQIVWLFY